MKEKIAKLADKIYFTSNKSVPYEECEKAASEILSICYADSKVSYYKHKCKNCGKSIISWTEYLSIGQAIDHNHISTCPKCGGEMVLSLIGE